MLRDNRFSRFQGVCRSVGLGVLLSTGLVGCFGSNYRASYSMANVQAKPASLMVAQKIDRPLYLVIDAARVPDSWDMKQSSSMNPQDGPSFKLLEFQQFVSRDLKAAMGNYFSRVEVVKAGDPLPSEPHVVGDVKVDRVQLHSVPTGRLVYTVIEMTWGLGLRPSEAKEYAFTFAGEGRSSEAYPTFEAGCAQLVESAILGFNKSLTEKGGLDALRQVASVEKPAPAADTTKSASTTQEKAPAAPATPTVKPAKHRSK